MSKEYQITSKNNSRQIARFLAANAQSDSRLTGYILNAMMRGVSMRNYKQILPEVCERAGVSKSSISRQFALASEEECARLLERRFDEIRMLIRRHRRAYSRGLEEMFTVNRLSLPASLTKCLVSTNIIESPNSGVKSKTRRVTNWKDGKMVKRWVASSLLATEKSFRRIMGYRDLWILKAALDDGVDEEEKAA